MPDDVDLLKSMILAERLRNAQLQHLLDVLRRMQFGKRSEKVAPDRLALALEDSAIGQAEAEALIVQRKETVEPQTRKRRDPEAQRASLPAHLPRVEIEIMPEVSECPCFRGDLRGGMWAAKLLGDYQGILQVDGYEAYRQFGKANRPGGPATLAYCWAK